MEEEKKQPIELPENAFRELKEGEEYTPIMSPDKNYPEVNAWSVSWGIVMAVIFSAAAAFLGLKVGQVFEAAIPIAIIAVGLSNGFKRKSALGENVIIQSIGACSGVIVAGAIFTLPALYILQDRYPEITVNFMEVFLSSLLGGILGILFLIPFRKYFVKDMHGKYPFPEATATTQVLVSETIAQKAKMVFTVNTGAAVLGLGYIIGLKYCMIICAGSLFVWFVIIPLLGMTSVDSMFLSALEPEVIFSNYARYIGIGGIAMAGIIGIVKSWGIIKGAIGLASKELTNKGSESTTKVPRTQRDISMRNISISVIFALILIFLFFYIGVIHNFTQALVAFFVVTIISFLFTTVAANAIAIVGSNPVSGMTLMTLILASVVMVAIGLKGTSGIVAALIIGGVVCTALSMAGGFITDLKIGYWLGSTPAKQETWKFLGTLVSAATVGGVILILNKTYGFTGENALVAPQANAMAAVIEPLMMGEGAPWLLYGVGAILALILNLLGVPALAFSLGMFIPLQLNTPLVIGGLISWFVGNRSKDAALNKARLDKGTLLASGFIAGGALMGVVSAAIRYAGFEYSCEWSDVVKQSLGLIMYLAIIAYLAVSSMRAKK